MAPEVSKWMDELPDFDAAAAEVWEWQRSHNPVVAEFCERMGSREMQFLPISFFREFAMKTGQNWEAEAVFESSGTTATKSSRHWVRDLNLYRKSLLKGFQTHYGEGEFSIFALLPHYLERGNSSLVHMVKEWITAFGLPGSGFFLDDFQALSQSLAEAMDRRERILLIGVSYALLDFAGQFPLKLSPDAIVMETGGMKGRRREMVRAELHEHLKSAFGVGEIHSEYGMTELLSQAYSTGSGRFRCPPWMKVVITDLHLPSLRIPAGQSGRICLIDLANVHSCSFIATDDVGRMHEDGSFEVLGRLAHAEMRGCNLMYAG